MAIKKDWIKDKKYITSFGGAELNVMRLAKEVCLKTDWDSIVSEAFEYAKREGQNPSRKFHGNTNQFMAQMWERTNQLGRTGKLHGSKGTIRIKGYSKSAKAAHGGPSYGITMTINNGCGDMETLIHELTHVAHLWNYKPHVGKKRRPHDIMFNRIMLMAMKSYFGFSKAQCNPFSMGYSVGSGYAPSRTAERHLDRFLGKGMIPKKLSKHFNKDLPKVKVVKVLTQEDKDKKVISGFRTTLTSTKKGMNNHDGYCDVMSDEYGIENGREYIENLLEQVKPTMKVDGLSEQDKEILEWLITDLQIQWFEYDNWEFSESAYARKENRMFELWGFLNREN